MTLSDPTSGALRERHFSSEPMASPSGAIGRAERYRRVRDRSVALAAPLSAEDCQIQSMADASPTKWHLAHITWFFETFVLEPNEPGFRPFDPAFRVLFNSYYQGVGERHPRAERGFVTRPDLATVLRYREDVDQRMQALIARREPEVGFDALVELGLQHEQQHQELILTDIKHALSRNPLAPAYAKRWPMAPVRPQPVRWVGFEEGLTEIGYDRSLDGDFAFDNETPRHRVFARGFELASRPATYGDWLAFMDDDGYRRPELWLSLGWDWVQSTSREAPMYWLSDRDGEGNGERRAGGGGWLTHTLQGRVAVDEHSPVCHLSFFEADAFARWSGARLPTEAEWEIAARRLPAGASTAASANFADRGAFHPLPQTAQAEGAAVQMFGDVWEWTGSAYLPYPGFAPLPGAVGEYNGKFMCNQFVLRGGSCATPAGHVRAGYRNFFPPEAQWQFSGVRLARDA